MELIFEADVGNFNVYSKKIKNWKKTVSISVSVSFSSTVIIS
jgi:hypothetical protein